MKQSSEHIALVQTDYRWQLASKMQIAPGAKVLEVGCGQGEMTAVLAELVGVEGRVLAVDLARPDYGAPQTLREATDLVRARPFGSRVDFRFEFDILKDQLPPDSRFDLAVFVHSGWYFESRGKLLATLSKIRKLSSRLCLAEWDLEPKNFNQLPHHLAVSMQGQLEAFGGSGLANVRTPFSRSTIVGLLGEAGWQVTHESQNDTASLPDADWEIGEAIRGVRSLPEQIPARLRDILDDQARILGEISKPIGNQPLGSYCLLAE